MRRSCTGRWVKHAGLTTFYGPALLPELGEHPTVLRYTDRWLRAAWFGSAPLRFIPATSWTDEFLDWDQEQDRTRPRKLRPSGGWVTIRDGVAEGQLVAGCLETVCRHLMGSPGWLDLQGALLVLETSEEVPPPHQVDAYLAELADAAVFEQITGLVVARPYGYDPDQTRRLWSMVAGRTEVRGIPVLGNVECGHADPMRCTALDDPNNTDDRLGAGGAGDGWSVLVRAVQPVRAMAAANRTATMVRTGCMARP